MKRATLLLLLFQCWLGQGVLSTDSDNCKCETQIFEVDEMSGTVKIQPSKEYSECLQPVNCLVYIKPLAGYTVVPDLHWKYYWAPFRIYYYKGEKEQTDMIPAKFNGDRYVFNAPVGVGYYINYTIAEELYDLSMDFKRVSESEESKICPPPIINVTSTKQVLKVDNWPKNGCAFRVQSNIRPAVTMFWNCNLHFRDRVSASRNGIGFEPKIERYSAKAGIFYPIDNGTDVQSRLENHGNCELAFVAPEYNPCNCSQPLHTLKPGETINLESPGYPEMFCPMINCNYVVNMTTLEDDHQMNTFVIEAIHMPQGNNEEIYFKIDGEKVKLEKWFGKTSMNILTGNQIEISYTALSVLSSEHGFSMNITAYQQPNDCRCPTNAPKLLTTDESHEMSIPPHCTHLMCRFALQNSSLVSQALHLDVNYTFHNDVLHVKGDTEFLLHTEPHLKQHHSSDIPANNSQVMITYLRKGVRKGLNATSELAMKWHWIGKDECNCGKTSLLAEPSSWSSFFSPRYPQDYCNNVDCTYRVWAPDGHHIQFLTKDFDTEIHRDILTFTEGNKVLKQMGGHIPNKTKIETAGQHATVHFHSDSTITAKGFIVSFIAVPNVGYVPEIDVGYISIYHILETVALILVSIIITLCAFKLFKKDLFKSAAAVTLENPVYSFSAKAEEVMMIVDKE